MRWVAVVLGSLSALTAGAAVAASPDAAQDLFGAAFANLDASQAGLNLGRDSQSEARYIPGQGLLRLTTGRVAGLSGPDSTFIDTIQISTAGYDPRVGAALLRSAKGETAGADSFGLSVIRNWPAALSIDAGRLTFDVTPHAGFGISTGGSQIAEAGALVRLQQKMLRAVGMTGAGERSHLYLFASASGRAVGLNLLRSDGALRPDQDDGFIREAEAGLGFQRGFVQASVGVSQQRTNLRALGEETRIDNRVGLTLSIR